MILNNRTATYSFSPDEDISFRKNKDVDVLRRPGLGRVSFLRQWLGFAINFVRLSGWFRIYLTYVASFYLIFFSIRIKVHWSVNYTYSAYSIISGIYTRKCHMFISVPRTISYNFRITPHVGAFPTFFHLYDDFHSRFTRMFIITYS